MKPRRVCVTGIGMVSPLGHSVDASWSRLLRGDTATVALFNTDGTCAFPSFFPDFFRKGDADKQKQLAEILPVKVAAPVPPLPNTGKRPVADVFAATTRATRHQLFAEHAAAEAMSMAGLGQETLKKGDADDDNNGDAASGCCPPQRRGVNIGVGMNSLHDISDAAHYVYEMQKLNRVSPFFVPNILTNTVSGAVAMQYLLRGPNHCTSTACATGAHCIGDAMRWIQLGEADLVVCGATEAAITPLGLVGFSRMKALAASFNDRPAEASRPFDQDRAGFVMGEGAGVLVLESEEHALRRGAGGKILAVLCGYGMSGDAYHVSSPHPDGVGAKLAMARALSDRVSLFADGRGEDEVEEMVSASSAAVRKRGQDVWHLNAHATSTPMGDEIELRAAMEMLRPEAEDSSSSSSCSPLLISSVKGSIGHLLGAAGAVETIFAIKSLLHGIAPPTANLGKPILDDATPADSNNTRVKLVRGEAAEKKSNQKQQSDLVLANSFGFGGTNACLLLAPPRAAAAAAKK